jgi:MFS family permease
VSFLTDAASEMILPVLPLFLTRTLGAGPAFVGLIEGAAEASSSLFKAAGGRVSDRLGRRKALVLAGYGLSNAVKPLLVLARSWTQVLAIRFTDRIGKGIRTVPRDALIAESVSARSRGWAFGFHRALDTAGAAVGSILAFAILSARPGDFTRVFVWSALPGMAAVAVLALFVRDAAAGPRPVRGPKPPPAPACGGSSEPAVRRLAALAVLTAFAGIGYAFALLRAGDAGVPARMIPLLYLLYNAVYAGCAVPVGILSDRWGRRPVLALGLALNAAVAAGLARASAPAHALALFVAYGVVSAVIETVPRALAADAAPASARASGFGLVHAAGGLAALPAAFGFGLLWERFGAGAAFGLSAASSAAALLWLCTAVRPVRTA